MKLIDIITNQDFLAAVFSTIFVIMLAFFLRRKNIIKENAKTVISSLVLKLGLPAMAFSAFMTDLNANEFKSNMQVLILGICLYIFLIIGSFLILKLASKKLDQNRRDVLSMIVIFGNCTFFSSPIIEGFYGDAIKIPEYLMIVAFRLFLYTYAFFVMSGTKVDKHHIFASIKKFIFNPIIIATFLGILIWSLQNVLPHVNITNDLGEEISVCIFRIDQTIPYIYKPVVFISRMTTPLSWILVGITIGEMPFKSAVKNISVWFASIFRTIIIPALIFGTVLLLQYLNVIQLTKYGFAACVLTLSAPLSVVIVSYAVEYDKDQYFVSDVSLISTIIAMISMPVMLVLVELITATSLF